MRIGIVTTSYPRFDGDPSGPFVAEHAAWLASAGHQVEVIAAGQAAGQGAGQGAGQTAELDTSVRVTRVPAAGDLFYAGGGPEALERSRRSWLHAARFSLAMTRQVAHRARNWDAVIAHWLVPSALAACSVRRPVIAIAHSGDVHVLSRTRLAGPMARLLLARRAGLVFVSESVRQRFCDSLTPGLSRRIMDASMVCGMGIDVARLRSQVRALRAPGRPARVVFLGRLVPVKGVQTLLAAAQQVREPAEFVIAGAGPDQQMLADRARTMANVSLVGAVYGAQRDALLASADVVVVPSIHVQHGRTEGMPVVALEAMAAGAPVIASRVGGLAELPPDTVRSVPEADPAALAMAIDSLIADRAAYGRQKAAADRFIDTHDWSVVGPKLLSLLS